MKKLTKILKNKIKLENKLENNIKFRQYTLIFKLITYVNYLYTLYSIQSTTNIYILLPL